MPSKFTQTMTLRCNDRAKLLELAKAWDVQQASLDVMGYMGGRLLADRHDPNRFVIVADFGMVDPDVTAADEALLSNERPETQAANERLLALVEGEIEYCEYDVIWSTD